MKIKIADFFKSIISLIISQILIKIFGVAYSLYLTNKNGFGDSGNAIYMSGYQIYALLLTISSIGVPNAISKIISEKRSVKDYINADRILKISIFIFSLVGFCGCISLFLFSEFIANNILEIPESKLSLMVLSPAVFFVSISSVFRGYCNGENKIYITAKSQIYEQVCKTILTIGLVEITSIISNNNTEIMAAVANFATTLATFLSLLYIVIKYFKVRKKDKVELTYVLYKRERIIPLIKRILIISVPMTLSAILYSLGKNIDSITVVRILKNFIGLENAKIKYGILSSKVDILVALPLSFNTTISTAIIPEISSKRAVNDLDDIIRKINLSVLITLIIGIPCTIGMSMYSRQIFNLLFPNANGGYHLLSLASFSIVFSMLIQTINGVLQGLGKNRIPIYAAIVGAIVKIISNIILIRIDGIYEKGAILGNIFSNLVSFIIVYVSLRKTIRLEIGILKKSIKPLIASFIMITSSLYMYNYLIYKNFSDNFSTITSIGIALIIYIICMFVMKMINKTDFCESTDK